MSIRRLQILVCDGPSCGITHESDQLVEHIEARLAADASLNGRVFVTNLTCFGRCDEGPNLLIRPLGDGEDAHEEPEFELLDGVEGLYIGMDEARVDRVLTEHCGGGTPIREWVESYS